MYEGSNINNRSATFTNGNICVCYLAEESKNICSPTFIVYIPAIMGGMDTAKDTQDVKVNTKSVDQNKGNTREQTLKTQNTILAFNLTNYGHRLDGWIPHFKMARMTMETGTAKKYSGQLSGGTTPDGCGPHTHNTTGTHTYTNIKMTKMEYKDINCYGNTEVDFQNINNKVIKKGHRMYGCFPQGEPDRFIILAIDFVTPMEDGKAARTNTDLPDKMLDGDKTPKNQATK